MINRERSLGVITLLTSAVLSACAQLPGEEETQPLGVHGPSWGHTGGGPGYQASAQHLAGLGATVCVMAAIEHDFDAHGVAGRMLEGLASR